jgi:hypothetical protein
VPASTPLKSSPRDSLFVLRSLPQIAFQDQETAPVKYLKSASIAAQWCQELSTSAGRLRLRRSEIVDRGAAASRHIAQTSICTAARIPLGLDRWPDGTAAL